MMRAFIFAFDNLQKKKEMLFQSHILLGDRSSLQVQGNSIKIHRIINKFKSFTL